jgi:hypothetical protein
VQTFSISYTFFIIRILNFQSYFLFFVIFVIVFFHVAHSLWHRFCSRYILEYPLWTTLTLPRFRHQVGTRFWSFFREEGQRVLCRIFRIAAISVACPVFLECSRLGYIQGRKWSQTIPPRLVMPLRATHAQITRQTIPWFSAAPSEECNLFNLMQTCRAYMHSCMPPFFFWIYSWKGAQLGSISWEVQFNSIWLSLDFSYLRRRQRKFPGLRIF